MRVQCEGAVIFLESFVYFVTPLQREGVLSRRHRVVGQKPQRILISGACFFPSAQACESGRDFQMASRVIGIEFDIAAERNQGVLPQTKP